MAELKAGDEFPEGVTFSYVPYVPENEAMTACGVPQKYNASQEFKNQKVVLVAVPGAFTPTCQVAHVTSFIKYKEDLKTKGVDQVIFIASNDIWVMAAWGKANGIKDDSILFMSDVDAQFSSSIGWAAGGKTNRYALVIDHGKVTYAGRDTVRGSIEFSGAEPVLAKL